MLTDFFLAIESKFPFSVAWKRARHIRHGHPFGKSTMLEKHRFKSHPQNDDHMKFTVNLMRCDDCGLCWLDEGFESTTCGEYHPAAGGKRG